MERLVCLHTPKHRTFKVHFPLQRSILHRSIPCRQVSITLRTTQYLHLLFNRRLTARLRAPFPPHSLLRALLRVLLIQLPLWSTVALRLRHLPPYPLALRQCLMVFRLSMDILYRYLFPLTPLYRDLSRPSKRCTHPHRPVPWCPDRRNIPCRQSVIRIRAQCPMATIMTLRHRPNRPQRTRSRICTCLRIGNSTTAEEAPAGSHLVLRGNRRVCSSPQAGARMGEWSC
jgi:hypothetical protein